uniref:(northern house mosquito) hypothetical protein n=1 Tax=Culex pipiens TaxID=7175 RepID=A0A8D8F9L1_CULPI
MQPKRNMGLLIVNQKEFGIQGLLVETAVKYAESNKHVLFITEERIKNVTPDFLRNYNNAVYRKLKFIYSKSSAAILLKLNEVHGWNFTPSLVIVEAIQKNIDDMNTSQSPDDAIYYYSTFVASIFDAVETFSRRLQGRCQCILTISQGCFDDNLPHELFFQQGNIFSESVLNSSQDVLDILRESLALG